ncbi:MAG: hypothetical protein AB7U82_07010 [Blastocatellales bacterium]
MAVSRKIIANERGSYAIFCRDIHDYTHEDRIEALLGALGRGG